MRKCLAPFFLGRPEAGLDRQTGNFDLVLSSDLVGESPGSIEAVVRINRAVRDVVAEHVARSLKLLVLCGDCLSAIGCLAGLEKCGLRPHLLWFDAHGDFHTHETTLSGHLGGMPLAMITGRGDLSLLSEVGLSMVSDKSVCLIGARDLERGERELLAASSILQTRRLGDALERIPRQEPVWIHFDTDYINQTEAPAMRYPAIGGPTALEVRSEFNVLARECAIVGMSMSAWAPHLDKEEHTAATCWQAATAIAGL